LGTGERKTISKLNRVNEGEFMNKQTIMNTSINLTKIKSLILAYLLVGAMITILPAPVQAAELHRQTEAGLGNTFSILLSGPYKPVVHAPDLGLTTVDLNDGSYSKTKIFRVSGLPEQDRGHGDRDGDKDKPIGTFYVQFAGSLVAYDLPGGAISMVFIDQSNFKPVPDGQGGTYFVGSIELTITEANGIYQGFAGGHNTMVDILHQLPNGTFVEHCICIISRPKV
jgi:hypothetical protein